MKLHAVIRIEFPNSKTRDSDAIKEAFAAHGLTVVLIQRELYMWTWVMLDDHSWWLHDKSHGGGGYFAPSPTLRPEN